MNTDTISQFMDASSSNAPYTPRECEKCNRWLRKGWRGDVCSKCQFKAKYHRNVLNKIGYKFKNNPAANPFTNDIDFKSTEEDFNKRVAKFVGIHFTEFDNNETIVLKLEFFRELYLNKLDGDKKE